MNCFERRVRMITRQLFSVSKRCRIYQKFSLYAVLFWNEYLLSLYPESSKSLPFGVDLTLLLEQYRGQQTTIARKLCLQSFRHLRHKSLYVLLPVLELIKKSHSCFNFFDNLAIEKTPFTHLDKGYRNAHPKSPDFKKFLLPPLTCLNREAKKWGYFEKKFKSLFTCLKQETILGGCFWKNFLKNFGKQKNLLPIHRTERRKWMVTIKL